MKEFSILDIIRREKQEAIENCRAEELFESRAFEKHVSQTVDGLLLPHGKKVSVKLFHNGFIPGTRVTTACTDGNKLFCNTKDEIVYFYATLSARYRAQMGKIFHECSHILFTEFDALNKAVDDLRYGNVPFKFDLVPQRLKPQVDVFKELVKEPGTRALAVKISKEVIGRLLDPHDEGCLIAETGPFVKGCIDKTAESLRSSCRFYEDAADIGVDRLSMQFNSLLQLCRFGDVLVRNEEAYQTEDLKALFELKPYADAAVVARTTRDFLENAAVVIAGFIPFLEDEAGCSMQDGQSQSGNGGKSSEGTSDKQQSGFQGEGMEGCRKGEGQSEEGASGSKGGDLPEDASGNTNDLEENGSSNGESSDKQGENSFEDASESSDTEDGSESDVGEEMEEPEGLSKEALEGIRKAIEEMLDDLLDRLEEATQGSGSSEMPEGSGRGEEAQEAGKPSDSEEAGGDKASLDALLNDYGQEKAEEEAVKALQNQGTMEVKTINFASDHAGIPIRFEEKYLTEEALDLARKAEEEYAVSAVVRRIAGELGHVIMDDARGGRNKGLFYGKTLEGSQVYRRDHKVFSNKKRPKDFGSLAISILCDNSGSMGGERIKSTRLSSYILSLVCSKLNIPCEVAGHTTDGPGVLYYVYKDFNAPKGKEAVCMTQQPDWSNRDGMAIKVACERLAKRPEHKKLFIIISDGQPNHIGYGGEEAAKDMRNVLKEAKRSGIEYIAAAIGSDKERLKEIYGEDSVLDIEDLDRLPKALLKIFKRKVLE